MNPQIMGKHLKKIRKDLPNNIEKSKFLLKTLLRELNGMPADDSNETDNQTKEQIESFFPPMKFQELLPMSKMRARFFWMANIKLLLLDLCFILIAKLMKFSRKTFQKIHIHSPSTSE